MAESLSSTSRNYTQFIAIDVEALPAHKKVEMERLNDYEVFQKASKKPIGSLWERFFKRSDKAFIFTKEVLDENRLQPISYSVNQSEESVARTLAINNVYFNPSDETELIKLRDRLRDLFPSSRHCFVVELMTNKEEQSILCLLVVDYSCRKKTQIAFVPYTLKCEERVIEITKDTEEKLCELPVFKEEEISLLELLKESEKVDGNPEHWQYYLKDERLKFEVESCLELMETSQIVDVRSQKFIHLLAKINWLEALGEAFKFEEALSNSEDRAVEDKNSSTSLAEDEQEASQNQTDEGTGELISSGTDVHLDNTSPPLEYMDEDRLQVSHFQVMPVKYEPSRTDNTMPLIQPSIVGVRAYKPISSPRIGLLVNLNQIDPIAYRCPLCISGAKLGEQKIFNVHVSVCSMYRRGPTSYLTLVPMIPELNISEWKVVKFFKLRDYSEDVIPLLGMTLRG
ncbi:hypothetical protein JQC92_02200 [Shewanella sp. 202IG2-18]|uniref:hypothetical protein n=1 Tax=Parashewanella hymeniacidonis TaxID=2807618 RepID=UPI0019600EEA|nr:hypothetical protein [Parashewanella hymeniacidonis]MBM7070852.1 hypothetical protein [Parashewanella hymeniacidonis]